MKLQDLLSNYTPSSNVQFGAQKVPSIKDIISQYAPTLSSILQQAGEGQQQANSPIDYDTLQSLLSGQLGQNQAQGGSGNDTIMQSAPAQQGQQPQQEMPSSLNDILNQFSSGKGNVDYQGLADNYPQLQSMAPQDKKDLISNYIQTTTNPEGLGYLGLQSAANMQADNTIRAQQGAINQAQNARDVAKYNAMLGLAEKGGMLQNEATKAAQEGPLKQAEANYYGAHGNYMNSMANRADLLQAGYDPQTGISTFIDKRNPNNAPLQVQTGIPLKGNFAKKGDIPLLSAAQESELGKALKESLMLDKNNAPINTDELPISGTDINKIKSAAGILMATGKARTANEALGKVMDKVNLVPDKSGVFGSNYRKIDNPDSLNTIINNGTSAAIASAPSTSGNGPTPNQIEKVAKEALKQGASADDLKQLGKRFGLDIDANGNVLFEGSQ